MLIVKEAFTVTCKKCGKNYYIRDTKDTSRIREQGELMCMLCFEINPLDTGKYKKVLSITNDETVGFKENKYFSEFNKDENIDSEKYPALALSPCEEGIVSCAPFHSTGDTFLYPVAKVTAEGVSKILTDDEEVPVAVECPRCKRIYDIHLIRSKGKERLYTHLYGKK